MRKDCICENNDENFKRILWKRDSSRGGGGQHQAGSLKASEGDVDPIAVLKPDLTLPAPVNDLLPEAENPFRWQLGAHEVGAKAEIPNEPKVGKRVLPEERVNLFDEREKRCVVVIVGEFGVKKTGIDVADRNELKGGVGGEKDMGRNPIGRFPMPLGIRGTNELLKIWTPISERDGCHLASVSQIMLFDCAGRVSKFKLRDLWAMLLKEHGKPFPSITEVRRDDRDVGEERHVPRREDTERSVVQVEFQGTECRKSDLHRRGRLCE